jgi:hypothetical protein
MPKRKPKKKTSAPKTTRTHMLGASSAGKQHVLSAVLNDMQRTGKPFTILDPHGELLPKPHKSKG